MRVSPDPDTLAIKPGTLSPVNYVFSERGGVDASVDSQNARFFTLNGMPLGQPCNGCRILGGAFPVHAGTTITFTDNVLLPDSIANEAKRIGSEGVNLRTTFNIRDMNGNELSTTAIVKIYF
jgi:hypothetical protein